MNDFEIKASSEAVAEDDLRNFEKNFGFQLPQDYRNFLLQHNGGIPKSRCFDVSKKVDFVINCFYPLSNEVERNLRYQSEAKPDSFSLKDYHAVIGDLDFGNCLVIDCRDGTIGAWLHDDDKIYLAAKTFSEFIAKLEPLENDPIFDYLTDDALFESMLDIAQSGNMHALHDLLDQGFDVNRKIDGMTLFSMACAYDNVSFLKKLKELGAEDSGGLHKAVRSYAIDNTLWLLDEGVDINELDRRGKTPLDYAENRPALTPKLLDKGAKHASEL